MNLQSLFAPRSIAVVGASEKPSVSRAVLNSLRRMGYTGGVYPINPRYEEVLGYRCYPSLAEIPESVDTAIFCVSNNRLVDSYAAAVDKGIRGAVIYSAGFSEAHTEEGDALSKRITGMSREAGIALLGPNCMGVLNPATANSMYMHEVFDPARVAGQVGFMSQSGAMCIGMIADCRRYGFSHVVSTGNEEVVSSCDVLEALIDDPDTRVIASFTESVKEPERFVALLDRAAAANKPVVILKVGKTARAQRAIISHTGGLAGESTMFSAILRAHRAIEVDDLGAMSEVLAVLQGARWPAGNRLAVVTGSGGQTELLLDISEKTPVQLPALSDRVRKTVAEVVGEISGDGNPLDAWGNGNPNENYPYALKTLGACGEFDMVAFCGDGMDGHPVDDPAEDLLYAEMVATASGLVDKPLAFLTPRAGVFRTDQEAVLRKAGVAMLSGAREALFAIAKVADWSRAVPGSRAVRAVPASDVAISIDQSRASINEYDAKQLLKLANVPVTPEALCSTLDEALQAVEAIGFPVVLKVASDAIPHKTEYKLIELNLVDADGVVNAWHALQSRVGAMASKPAIDGILVQKMIKGGIEVLIGVNRDADYGPMLVFGLGGTLVDLSSEVATRPLPLAQGDAAAMIREVGIADRLLNGVRGAVPADRDALAACLYAVSDFVVRSGGGIAELDLNPVKVLDQGQGCVVVDAVIIPFAASHSS